jgi:hypothetical protein
MGKKFSGKNNVCLLLPFLSVAVAFFYSIFILAHIDHDCAGEDCAVCGRLRLAGEFLRQMEFCAARALFIFSLSKLFPACAQLNADFLFAVDPVSLKVRLNN